MSSTSIKLEILSGLRAGDVVRVQDGRIMLGRSPDCTVPFEGEIEMSKRHARLWREGARWRLEDLHSANGTFARTEEGVVRVDAPVTVRDGDEFIFGRVAVRVRLVPEDAGAECTLRVRWERDTLHYSAPDGTGGRLTAECPLTREGRRHLQRRLHALATMAHAGHRGTHAAGPFTAFGRELAAAVLPEAVARWLRERTDGPCMIAADAEAALLPWELLALEETPLCLATDFARAPWEPAHAAPESATRTNGPPRLLVIADPQENLPSLHAHAERLLETLSTAGARVTYLAGARARRAVVLGRLAECDALYFIGHGVYTAHAPEESALLLHDGPLAAADFRRLDRAPRFVFANGCDTSREATRDPDSTENDFSGLSSAFLRAGARAYLGARWPISADAAASLADHLFAGLLRGVALPRALRRARAAALSGGAGGCGALAHVLCAGAGHDLLWGAV